MLESSSLVKSVSSTLCIELNNDEFLDSRIVRLQKGWTLRFVCGRELLGKSVKLEISNAATNFNFKKLTSLRELDDNNTFDYKCDEFGAFSYKFYVLVDSESREAVGGGYFSVVPEWRVGGDAKRLSLNGLSVVTHLTKLLGPLSEWRDRLRVSKEAGYNVVHLTPVQTLGISNSSYSVADYQKLNPTLQADFTELKNLVAELESDWHMLTIQDVVWNHAAKNAAWLRQHPECAFNCANSPHLRPAFVVDRALLHFSHEIAAGKWILRGLPPTIDADHHIAALASILETDIFPALHLQEFFQVDVERCVAEFRERALTLPIESAMQSAKAPTSELIVPNAEFRRFGASIDVDACLRVFNKLEPGVGSDEERIERCCDALREFLKGKNAEAHALAMSHSGAAIQATLGHVSYERVAAHGPRRHLVTEESPLVTCYFLYPSDVNSTGWREDERLAYDPDKSRFLMACNGWVMNADPLVNFAEPPSLVYLRRELVCWGDCVKLNYGRKPEDCPYLWDYMRQYTEQCAAIFHGFRIDNCHSTPIHVAEVEFLLNFTYEYYLLNAARKVRHNLYVVAELFTGSETTDHLFVNRLGITSLVRECQNAPDSHEQGRFVYRYGGDAVGAFRSKNIRPAPSGVAHALFYDQTHDNPSPVHKRTVYDYVPTAAMTAMAYCASGTTRGYDELIPYHIDVVREKRPYNSWSEICANPARLMGMIRARKLFNTLHADLAETGYSEIFVDQINEDIVAITRHNPTTHESVLLVSHCCFNEFKWTPNCKDIPVADDITDILFEVKMSEDNNIGAIDANYEENHLCGLSNYRVEIYENIPLDKSMAVEVSSDSNIHFKVFTSGSVIAFKIKPKDATIKACRAIENIVADDNVKNDLIEKLRQLDLQDFNYLLFRCEAEERAQDRAGSYDVPNYGKLVYCGIQGIYSVMRRIQETNDLGHPLCGNLRDGTWLCDHIVHRLKRHGDVNALTQIADVFSEGFQHLSGGVPHFLRPCYFELLLSYYYSTIELVINAKIFHTNILLPRLSITERLELSSVSFVASIENAKLPPIVDAQSAKKHEGALPPTLSAGLPHFAEGIWRNWGRDTFIALPGVLLLNGRFAEARDIILGFAGTLRHGLIPNLLAEGRAARYNCRDAVWFWLTAILKYAELAPNGVEILKANVLRLYPTDDAEYLASKKIEPLHDTMYEAICRHFKGIAFRERNAGHQIDEHMTHDGFNINACVNHSGLVYGGNRWNCGTWMDKMGSSDRAGNRGVPATPRDGAAVELQGLALFVAERLHKLHSAGQFPYGSVGELDSSFGKSEFTWKHWAHTLRASFADRFYVSDDCNDKFVHRRGIVKDSVDSSTGYTDFQLRPNFCITLDAVPDILEPEKAWRALEIAREVLDGPLGMKTLDTKDWAYNGYYNNDDDGTNRETAKGWNYHQGPEWLWVAGIYLSAKLKVAHIWSQKCSDLTIWEAAVEEVMRKLHTYASHIHTDPWSSLPELTNRDGAPCLHSCPAQAWSIGCFTEALYTLNAILEQRKGNNN